MFSFESAWHRTEKDKTKQKKKKKRVYCNSQKKKKKKKKKKEEKWAARLGFSNFNRLFSPDYASAAQVLYL